MDVKHVILMKEIDGDTEVKYNNVISCTYLYGCLLQLNLADDSTATFDNNNWYMYDLTPSYGWNYDAINF